MRDRPRWRALAGEIARITVTVQKLDGPDAGTELVCSRLATPLVNEVILPLSEVDEFRAGTALETVRYTSTAFGMVGEFAVLFELAAPVADAKGGFYGVRLLKFEE